MKNDIPYSNGAFIPGTDGLFQRWEDEARVFREREAAIGKARLNAPYGPGERERLDIFHPSGRAEGLVIFIHGGYWHSCGRELFSHFAAGLTARDWVVAMPSYPLCPDARIADITRAIARAVNTAAGFVPGPIRITGHSAGGHLSARMACRDVLLDAEVRTRIARILPISPVSDLRPLIETSMNADFRLDDDLARAESPALHEKPDTPVTVWVGAEERPAFLDQARWLAEAWSAEHRIAPGRHHFDVTDELQLADSPLVNALLA